MIIHRCDRCGEEIKVWVEVETMICTAPGYEYINVSDMLPLKINNELCKNCAKEVINTIKYTF